MTTEYNNSSTPHVNTTIISLEDRLIFPSIVVILSRYVLPLVLLFGNIGCLLSIIVFLQKSMRKNPSGLYFLSSSICNIIFINAMIPTTIIYYGFNIDPSGKILILCRLQFYIALITGLLSSILLVLASVDRFIISSSNCDSHRYSNRAMAVKLILSVTMFCCILHIHAFFFIVQTKGNNQMFYCLFKTGKYTIVLIFYEILIHDLLIPILMVFFSIRTIMNVRHVMIHPMSRLSSADRQLIIIMLSQCFIYLTFRLPLLVHFLSNYIITNKKNSQPSIMNITFLYMSLLCFFMPYCMFFFVNLMLNSFRNEFKRLLRIVRRSYLRKIRRWKQNRNNQIYPLAIIYGRGLLERPLQ